MSANIAVNICEACKQRKPVCCGFDESARGLHSIGHEDKDFPGPSYCYDCCPGHKNEPVPVSSPARGEDAQREVETLTTKLEAAEAQLQIEREARRVYFARVDAAEAQLAALQGERDTLLEAAAFLRNTRISDSHGFKGDWWWCRLKIGADCVWRGRPSPRGRRERSDRWLCVSCVGSVRPYCPTGSAWAARVSVSAENVTPRDCATT